MRFYQCLSVPRTLLFIVCLLPSLFFSQAASAVDYYWVAYLNSDRGHFSSPEAACQRLQSATAPLAGTSQTTVYHHKTKITEERYECFFQIRRYSSGSWTDVGTPTSNVGNGGTSFALRRGDQCPTTKVYDTNTGECLEPPPVNPCESTNGQTTTHEHKMKAAVGQPTIDPPGSICANSCAYAFTFTAPSNVYVYTSGEPPGVFGVYTYKSAGFQCTGGETAYNAPGNPTEGGQTDPDATPPPDSSNNCPSGYTYNGTFCSPNNPPPDPDPSDPKDPTDPTDPADPGGDTGGGTGGGGTGGGTGGDTGGGTDDGSGTGTGDGSGDGGGTGGGGSGTGDGEPTEEPPTSSVSGEACKASVACEGDAIQCAILRQQKAQKCADEDFRDMSGEKVAEMKTGLDGEFSRSEYQPLTPTSASTFDLSSMIDTSSRFSNSCPVVPDWNFPWIDGQSINVPIGSVIAQFCQYLAWFGYFVVAFAMRRAAEIIAMGMN